MSVIASGLFLCILSMVPYSCLFSADSACLSLSKAVKLVAVSTKRAVVQFNLSIVNCLSNLSVSFSQSKSQCLWEALCSAMVLLSVRTLEMSGFV